MGVIRVVIIVQKPVTKDSIVVFRVMPSTEQPWSRTRLTLTAEAVKNCNFKMGQIKDSLC